MQVQVKMSDDIIYKLTYYITQQSKVNSITVSDVLRTSLTTLANQYPDLSEIERFEAKGRLIRKVDKNLSIEIVNPVYDVDELKELLE